MIIDFTNNKVKQEQVGGKFYNLIKLNKILEINIPDAFCITQEDFNKNKILQRLKPGICYAVRSSANLEDLPGLSAAGMFETFLDLQDHEEILSKINLCFEAVNSERVRAYFKNRNIPLKSLKMSVIVQEMIFPEKSGVLFTRNPVNGKNELLLEMVDGLGEQVVSGKTLPTRIILNSYNSSDDPMLNHLVENAQIIKKIMKSDQDIEWAWKKGKLYILQSRPMVQYKPKLFHPEEVWTRANIAEIIPKPLTPLSWSVFREVIFKSYRFGYYSLFDRLLTNVIHVIPRKHSKITSPQSFSGHLYLNFETIFNSFGKEPFVSPEVLEIGLGFRVPPDLNIQDVPIRDRIIRFIKSVIFLVENLIPSISMEVRLTKSITKRLSGDIFTEKPLDLEKLLDSCRLIFGWHIAATARNFSHLGFLMKYLKFKKKRHYNQESIVSVLSLNNDNSKNDHIPGSEKSREIIEQDFYQKDLDSGQRNWNEFELAPNSMSNYYNNNGTSPDSITAKSGRQEERKKHFSVIERKLSKRFQKSLQLRENLKYLLIRIYQQIGKYYMAVGEQLKQNGTFSKMENIFYLEINEVSSLINEDSNKSENILKRKKLYQKQLKMKIPHIFYKEFRPLPSRTAKNHNEILQGVGCSAGIARGFAKIVYSPDQGTGISSANIIIVPAADPGWTPLLLKSAGMISEVGGVLSHIATIARENKIPLVTGIDNITNLLKNGKEIQMDGLTGKVSITDLD